MSWGTIELWNGNGFISRIKILVSKYHSPVKGTVLPRRNDSVQAWCRTCRVRLVNLIGPGSTGTTGTTEIFVQRRRKEKTVVSMSQGWNYLGIKGGNFNKLKHRYKNLWVRKCNKSPLGVVAAPILCSENWQIQGIKPLFGLSIQTAFQHCQWLT